MNLKRIALASAALIALLVVVPFLIPMGTYLPRIERMVSEKVGAPVTIKSLHLAVLPSPRVTVSGIVMGKDAEIQVDKVSAVLDIRTVFEPVKVISSLEVRKPVVKKAALALISPLIASENKSEQPAPVVIRHIDLHEARFEMVGMTLPAMDGVVEMAGGKLQQATFSSSDGKLKMDVLPKGEGVEIALGAEQWTPPVGPPLLFDSLKVQAKLEGSHLDIPSIDARLYEGAVNGSASLDWVKLWRLSGKLKVAGMEVGKPARLFNKTVQVSGKMTGNGSFAASAANPDELKDRAVVDFTFDVKHGVLYGVDLAKAASLFIKQGQSGGETQFDELSGVLHAVGKQYDLRDLIVVSGLLAANGRMKVSPEKKLDGQVDVELKRGVALVTVPLQISGTADAPVVMPTKAAMAGAAAGTAILGPLGTGLGMKAGAALDRWFGDKK